MTTPLTETCLIQDTLGNRNLICLHCYALSYYIVYIGSISVCLPSYGVLITLQKCNTRLFDGLTSQGSKSSLYLLRQEVRFPDFGPCMKLHVRTEYKVADESQ